MGSAAWVGLIAILVLNVAIAWSNARACGRAWVESKALGGWLRVVVWCGATQSAIGFSMAILFPLAFAARKFAPNLFTSDEFKAIFDLWYVAIILPTLGTGFLIAIESWIRAHRDHSLANIGRAAYNTLAETHNAIGAVQGFWPAMKEIGKLFSDDGREKRSGGRRGSGGGIILLVAIVAFALLAGVILTAVLIHHYAGTVPLPASAAGPAAGAGAVQSAQTA